MLIAARAKPTFCMIFAVYIGVFAIFRNICVKVA